MKNLFSRKNIRRIGCLLLTAVMLLLLGLPIFQRPHTAPDNPIPHKEIENIEIFQGGESENLSGGNSENPDSEGSSGTSGGTADNQGGSETGDTEDDSQSVSPDEKDENTEAETKPHDGPTDEDLSDSQIGTMPDTDPNGQEGQEDGEQGEEGGETAELQLGAVLYWYKYGTQEKTVVCSPNETVGKVIMTAQLPDGNLKYRFALTGEDAENAKITGVTLRRGDSVAEQADTDGSVSVVVRPDPGFRNYIFQVEALALQKDSAGKTVEQPVTFTYVLRCENGKDLELKLSWPERDGTDAAVVCRADREAAKSINGADLKAGQLHYTVTLSGELADRAELLSAVYTTGSGETGTLDPNSGTLVLKTPEDSDTEIYDLLFTVRLRTTDSDGDAMEQQITYKIRLKYENILDLQLHFTWFERGTTPRKLMAKPGEQLRINVKNNQLSAGAMPYEVKLSGTSAPEARIRAISCRSGSGGTQKLEPIGSLPMQMNGNSETYIILITVQVGAEKAIFTVNITFTHDVVLQMHYTTTEEGTARQKLVTCENGKTVTAELVFDDQLRDGNLPYTFTLDGQDVHGLEIVSVRCYQSGAIRSKEIPAQGTIQLLLDKGKTGENTFTVTARDIVGNEYTFRINVPYKHRGHSIVKISTNLWDGVEVTNGSKVNLHVRAWVEDAQGNTVSHILATGTNGSKITVKLDGEEIPYFSSSGTAQEYLLEPKNPETGDTNTHTLSIYAEDQYGNYGNYEITLKGKRTQSGQVLGKAQVYIDMTVLGLGVQGPVPYTVLSKEPVSNVVPKVVWGDDTGEPFGRADQTFGWHSGKMAGTIEKGFYLKSMSPGNPVNAQAMYGSNWGEFGNSEEEICRAIDEKFGEGTGLATLWRCICRNGLSLSTMSPYSIGEFDFTNGSGWVYTVNGHYPGESMSSYFLKDGDVLTLRYTLAQGWDVGTGTEGYGQTVGYCVSAADGSFRINHRWEEVTTPDGRTVQQCKCCGLQAQCPHTHTEYRDMGNGTHALYCTDCQNFISQPEEHNFKDYINRENPDTHSLICSDCGCTLTERHSFEELSNTATCTEPGIRTVHCIVCDVTLELPVPAKGHQTDNQYFYDAHGHYQTCEICGQELNRGPHHWVYLEAEDDWECSVCQVLHGWSMDHFLDDSNLVPDKCTCQNLVYHCPLCGQDFTKPGVFEAWHHYENGVCIHCGAQDPDAIAPPPPKPDSGDNQESDPQQKPEA